MLYVKSFDTSRRSSPAVGLVDQIGTKKLSAVREEFPCQSLSPNAKSELIKDCSDSELETESWVGCSNPETANRNHSVPIAHNPVHTGS